MSKKYAIVELEKDDGIIDISLIRKVNVIRIVGNVDAASKYLRTLAYQKLSEHLDMCDDSHSIDHFYVDKYDGCLTVTDIFFGAKNVKTYYWSVKETFEAE